MLCYNLYAEKVYAEKVEHSPTPQDSRFKTRSSKETRLDVSLYDGGPRAYISSTVYVICKKK